jgi:uncharacterized BrkB/YihY/UPF0761 family membrane protein
MIYLKSIGVALAVVFGSVYALMLVLGILSRFTSHSKTGYWIALTSPYFWLPSLLLFTVGFVLTYRRLSKRKSTA